jgi:hypothetical protein
MGLEKSIVTRGPENNDTNFFAPSQLSTPDDAGVFVGRSSKTTKSDWNNNTDCLKSD